MFVHTMFSYGTRKTNGVTALNEITMGTSMQNPFLSAKKFVRNY